MIVTTDVIEYDLEENPLQIKTDSVVGSGELVLVVLYTDQEEYISDIRLDLSSSATPKYKIQPCTPPTIFPVDLPVEQDKIWTITKTATALKIECNDVEVVDYLYSDSSDSRCVTRFSQDIEKIIFPSDYDTASDEYRQEPTGV